MIYIEGALSSRFIDKLLFYKDLLFQAVGLSSRKTDLGIPGKRSYNNVAVKVFINDPLHNNCCWVRLPVSG